MKKFLNGLKHVAKGAAIVGGTVVVTTASSSLINGSPLGALLPPYAKLGLALAAPVIAAWLKKSPLTKPD